MSSIPCMKKDHDAASSTGCLAVLLATGLGLQLAWQYREDLLKQFPALQPLCERIGCRPGVVHAPDKFSILQRDIKPTANETGSLTLSAQDPQ